MIDPSSDKTRCRDLAEIARMTEELDGLVVRYLMDTFPNAEVWDDLNMDLARTHLDDFRNEVDQEIKSIESGIAEEDHYSSSREQ